MKKEIGHIYFIILLSILSAIAPIAVDTYIPSMPIMAKAFHVSIEKIELTLSIFLLGFSIGQVIGGPLSDIIGRRKSSLIGLLGFSLFSLLIVFSNSIYELWVYRFIEALFGGLIVVNASAIVRDKFQQKEAAKVFSLIGSVRSIAPLVAPAVGALILYFFSWHAIFIFLSLFSLIVAFLVYKDLPETYTYVKTNIVSSYAMVFKNTKAMLIILVLALGFSGMFTIIAKSSFIYIEYFHVSPSMFPVYFGLNILTLMVMIRVNIKLLNHYSAKFLVQKALIFQIVIALLFILSLNFLNFWLVILFLSLYTGLQGFIYGNCSALALENFSKNAGVASSVIGVLQFGLGAIISSIVLMFHSHTLLPIAISLLIISSCAYLFVFLYRK